ncbi:MAG: DUF192 domain-containing protein [Lacunisphaera sp.]
MFSCRKFLPLCAVAFLVLLSACGNNDAKKTETAKLIDERFPIKVGDKVVQMQVALRPAETQKGLMFVKSMGESEGMIFVFTQPQPMAFWMRNTEIPLDIGYIDTDGTLREVYPMYAHDEKSVRSISNHHFALEMNLGWFARAGVKPGARLDVAALADAIRARGFKPEDFGLR